MTLTLPDSTALDSLLGALARLMEVPNGLAGQPTVVMKSKRASTIPLSDGLSQTHLARVGAGEQV